LDQPAINVILAEAQKRIQKAIATISVGQTTELRGFLDGYLRHVSPALARNDDGEFPLPLYRMALNPERTASPSFNRILLFLVGSAIVAYYAVVNGDADFFQRLENRIIKLEEIAIHGTSKFQVDGNDSLGYTLIRRK